MANGKIYELMMAIQTRLQTLPKNILTRVDLYDGVYDEDGVKRLVTSEGVLHLAFLGANNIEEQPGGPAHLHAAYGVYIASHGVNRIQSAVNRLEAVAAMLINTDDGFDVTYTLPTIIGSIENLYSKSAGTQGVAIFGMSFAVPIVIGENIHAAEFETYTGDVTWTVDDSVQGEIPLDPNDPEAV